MEIITRNVTTNFGYLTPIKKIAVKSGLFLHQEIEFVWQEIGLKELDYFYSILQRIVDVFVIKMLSDSGKI